MRYFNCFRISFLFFCGGWGCALVNYVYQSWSVMSSSWKCDYGPLLVNVSHFQVHFEQYVTDKHLIKLLIFEFIDIIFWCPYVCVLFLYYIHSYKFCQMDIEETVK
jgi:hypothetical protein